MDDDTIKHYLKIHVDLREKHASMNMREAGYAYSCQEDFVLREGTLYTEMSERVYKPGIPRYCFHNAYVAASRSRGKLRYCEGYALSSFMPVPHGWCIDPDGRVVDVTWCGDGSTERIDDGFYTPAPASEYLGIVFPIEYVRKIRKATTGACVIDNWEQNWPLLRTPLEDQCLTNATTSGRSA